MNLNTTQLESFGPLADLIQDESIEEIWINSPSRVFIAKAGKSELTNLVLTKDTVQDIIERLLIWGGRRLGGVTWRVAVWSDGVLGAAS